MLPSGQAESTVFDNVGRSFKVNQTSVFETLVLAALESFSVSGNSTCLPKLSLRFALCKLCIQLLQLNDSWSLMFQFFGGSLSALVLLSVSSTVYLYSYPFFNRCRFPTHANSTATEDADFRLLALGDPQLEGDSSLESLSDGYFPSLKTLHANFASSESLFDQLILIRHSLQELIISDLPRIVRSYRKRLDLWGNDYYLAHIYRTVHWFTKPTHVVVLGDLLGSQWVSNEEFERRGARYWYRVFSHGRKVDDLVTDGEHVELLGQDQNWETNIINVAGNHDIGYAGDITEERLQRFEEVFGRVNWSIRFTLPKSPRNEVSITEANVAPELRIVVLNSLNLDTPALNEELQARSYRFINNVISASRPVEHRDTFTILLTHLPLHKESGICVDSPYFEFYSQDEGGGVKAQNHLSYNAGTGILEGIYGMSGRPDASGRGFGRNGIILTGHDHEGCDVYHHLPETKDESNESRTWKVKRWDSSIGKALRSNKTTPGIREITLQSMMGEFRGNAGLLSAKFDHDKGEWTAEYSSCVLGKQHIWWTVHFLDLVTLGLVLTAGLLMLLRPRRDAATKKSSQKREGTSNKSIGWAEKVPSVRGDDALGRTTHVGVVSAGSGRTRRSRRR